jgi:hypothetical protein
MSKKTVCKCSSNNDNNLNSSAEKLSNQTKSCCKIEIKFISNSSDFENNDKVSKYNISTVLIFKNTSQLSNPSYSKIKAKDILLFFKIPNDIPVKNSSLLI